jgi:hypothetical protein
MLHTVVRTQSSGNVLLAQLRFDLAPSPVKSAYRHVALGLGFRCDQWAVVVNEFAQ